MFKNSQRNKLSQGLSLGMILTLIAGFNSSVVAQSQYERDNGYQSNEKDSIYGDAPGGLNPVDLIHRAQQLKGRSASEFEADSQGQMENSVSDFKRLQQQRILQQQQPTAESEESSDL
ncbi:hypothetical protein I4641_09550 [Waterburya agarophytonicola K14]|uniref:Uncharacterized protein n=1 Tax=Waterburya agarophytonicola KI4 TaxID=2874699 RepID=A0A964FFQ5_9CYAN|nr:hypothetical protein [Waterburya agarophytonicola]MCC0177221.1 hypothetical protein [Waterburya agarophytonicola KI4]